MMSVGVSMIGTAIVIGVRCDIRRRNNIIRPDPRLAVSGVGRNHCTPGQAEQTNQ